jgi:hypothetical protein
MSGPPAIYETVIEILDFLTAPALTRAGCLSCFPLRFFVMASQTFDFSSAPAGSKALQSEFVVLCWLRAQTRILAESVL